MHDVNILDELIPEPGSFYITDRAYVDFYRLYTLPQCLAFFVIRAKSNFQFHRVYSHPVDKSTGLKCDQTIVLTGINSAKEYPQRLRRVRYFDQETELNLSFLTNNFTLPALTIAQLYKCRWKVELFFKWIKQHLRIKSFYGTSLNAVKTQIWIAVSVYVLVAIIKNSLVWSIVSTQFCRFSVLPYLRNCLSHKYLQITTQRNKWVIYVTNCYYSNYNGTLVQIYNKIFVRE